MKNFILNIPATLGTVLLACVTLLASSCPAQTGAVLYGGSLNGNQSSPFRNVGSVKAPAEITLASATMPYYQTQYSTTTAPAPVSVVSPAPVYTSIPANIGYPTLPPLDPYAVPNQSSLYPASSQPISGTYRGSSSLQPGYGSPSYNSSAYPTTGRIYSGNFENFFPETYDAVRRFRDSTSAEFTFLPGGNKSDSFGLSQLDLRMQLSVPCRFIPTNSSQPGFLMITPGGQLAWWDGPSGPPDMSPNGFGAYLDFGVQPQFNDIFGVNAWFRFGVFSDFKKVGSESLRYQGGIEGVVNLSRDMQLVVGFRYLDRARVKMLPTGGIIWTPRDDWRLRLTFPDPKISKRLWQTDRAVWWGYIRAEYGGDAWSISGLGKTDYNDIRFGLGLEFETIAHVGGYFEFGGSFKRELYSQHTKWADPPSVIYLKTGFVF